MAWELSKYWLGLVGMQEVRWDNGHTEQAEEHNFFHGKGT